MPNTSDKTIRPKKEWEVPYPEQDTCPMFNCEHLKHYTQAVCTPCWKMLPAHIRRAYSAAFSFYAKRPIDGEQRLSDAYETMINYFKWE